VIRWLLVEAGPDPDGVPPGLLAPSERDQFGRLALPRRRADWLLGRFALKSLVSAWAAGTRGRRLSLDEIAVASLPSGAPVVLWPESWGFPAPSVSLSHRDGRALAALSDSPGATVGADLEKIEPRPQGFACDWFTPSEVGRLDALPAGERDLQVTLLWSAREAVVKALGVGLSVDTRTLPCEAEPAALSWSGFRLVPGAWDEAAGLRGWWRRFGPFVLAIAARSDPDGPCDEAEPQVQPWRPTI
jgi:4'-phosphopantetheinyl transferase